MKELTVIFGAVLVAGTFGFLIKVPDVQQPIIRTNSMGWIHMQKLLLPLFDNVCEGSTDPTIDRLEKEFSLDSIADNNASPETITNLKKLYAANGQLKKGAIFTEMNQDHMYEFQLLYDVLYNAQTFDTFYKTAAWARQNANCGLFVNAIYLAVLKRRDTEKISVPAPYELLPHYFIRQDVIIKASSLLAGEDMATTEGIVNEGNAYVLDANYTCNIDANDESKLAYFHEDIGLNTYYFLKRLQYAPWFHTEDVASNHAEFLYHFMKQLSARYNLERYSNGLTPLDKFDWTSCNIDSYVPMLVFSDGEEFTPRLGTFDSTTLQALQNIEENIMKMIPTMVQNGYTKAQIINNMMDMLVSNVENYEFDARKFFGGVAAENRCRSVLGHYMTSLRDPVFWKINKKIVNLMDAALKNHPGYTRSELYFPGVQVVNVEVKKISTMFEPFKFEVTDALKTATGRPMFDVNIAESRLNHKPFTMKLNISSLVTQKGLVKIYLGPKTLPGEFALKKDLFMLLDNFECILKIGSNVLSRTSEAIERTSDDFVSLKVLRKLVEDAEFGLEVQPLQSLESLSGFPSRLVLPKGTPEGLPMQLLVFVAPFTKVTAGGLNIIPKTEFNSAILSPGYPFDLDLDDKQFMALPNVLMKDIIVTHKENSGANKGKYDGSKKWGGSDKPNFYGPEKEPFDYNLKKSQYGKTQDYTTKTDGYPEATIEHVTDKVETSEDIQINDNLDLNEEDVSRSSIKRPYALKLRSSPYKSNDFGAKINKYYENNKNTVHGMNMKPENEKFDDKINIDKNIKVFNTPMSDTNDEHFYYNKKKSAYGNNEDYKIEKDDYPVPAAYVDHITDKALETKDFNIDGTLEVDEEKLSQSTIKTPHTFELRTTPYRINDFEAKRSKYFKGYKDTSREGTMKSENEKLYGKVNINKNVNVFKTPKTNTKYEHLNIGDMRMDSILRVAPKREWSSNVEETYKNVIPRNVGELSYEDYKIAPVSKDEYDL